MGYYRQQTVTRYSFPSSSDGRDYWFDWKNFASYGETKAVSKRIVDAAKAQGRKPEDIAPDEANAAMVIAYIAAWNAEDASGAPLPLVPEAVDQLEDIDAACLMELLNARMNAKAVERKNSVTSSVPSPSAL